MTHTNIYSVLDTKAGAYCQPFYSRNHETALRDFRAAVQTEGHQFNKHAADYCLCWVGTWYEDDGRIEPVAPFVLSTAAACLAEDKTLFPQN